MAPARRDAQPVGMTDIFTPLLALHIATGLTICVVGVVPILSAKGSRLHRFSGRLFVLLMAILLIAAWIMTTLHFNAYLLGLSATATYHVFSGVRVLGRKRPDARAQDRARPIDWGAAIGVAAVGLAVFVLVVTGHSEGPPAVTGGLAFAALGFGSWDLWRFARPTGWPFSPNLWTYEHLVKMLSAYSAVLSAFSGNFLTVLPAPWSQLWPSLFFPSLAMIWIAALVAGRRSPASA
jgi:uncharacterized membrane protein